MLIGLLTLVLAAAFSGAAVYVSFVEHPARAALDDRAALTEWQPSYKRGAILQASLAALATILAAVAGQQNGNRLFLIGALVQFLPWIWTLAVIRPTNNALLALHPSEAGPQSRALLEKWGLLHGMRTALGIAATVLFCWALAASQ